VTEFFSSHRKEYGIIVNFKTALKWCLNIGNKTYPLQLTAEYKQQQEVVFWTYAVFKPMTGKEYKGKKCKAIPLQAWAGPNGSRRLKLPDFKTIGT